MSKNTHHASKNSLNPKNVKLSKSLNSPQTTEILGQSDPQLNAKNIRIKKKIEQKNDIEVVDEKIALHANSKDIPSSSANADLYHFDTQWTQAQIEAAGASALASNGAKTIPSWAILGGAVAFGGVAIAIANNGGGDSSPSSNYPTMFDAFCAKADGLGISPQSFSFSNDTVLLDTGFDPNILPDSINAFNIDLLSDQVYGTFSAGNIGIAGVEVNITGDATEYGYVSVTALAGTYTSGMSTFTDPSEFIWAHDISIANSDASAEYVYGNVNLRAYANTTDASASVGICDIDIQISAQNAYATIYTAIASADNGGVASLIAHDISLEANGLFDASASISTLQAEAKGINSIASIDIGNVSVEANAIHGSANAYFNYITADALEDNAIATVTIDEINLTATSVFGSAYASMDDISANASDSGRASIDIGTINLYAFSETDTATATLNSITAEAYTFGEAHINIGNINIEADAANYASAYLSELNVLADNRADDDGDDAARASITIHDINITAIGRDDATAYAEMESIDVEAGNLGIASMNIHNINIEADASYDAQAMMDDIDVVVNERGRADLIINDINLDAHSLGDTAYATMNDISVDAYDQGKGNISIQNITFTAVANGASASATASMDDIDAYANQAGEARISIQNINLTATLNGGVSSAEASIDDIEANAYSYGIATVDIESIYLHAIANNGYSNSADASIDDITADAYEHGFAKISITDITVRAESINASNASASIDNIGAYALEYGTYTNQSAIAEINIQDVLIEALADAYSADASLGNIDAKAEGDYLTRARTEIDYITINAEGAQSASASLELLNAYAADEAVAEITITDININAKAGAYASAYAEFGGYSTNSYDAIRANAYDNASASVVIHDINMTAEAAGDDAYVFLGNLSAYAEDSGNANIHINDINLTNRGAGYYASISMYGLEAYAVDESADASITINDIVLYAEGAATSYSIGAYLQNMYAFADDGFAEISIQDISITAMNHASDATAYIGNIDASADGSGYASIDINSISVVAEGTGEYASASATIDGISANATGSSSEARVRIGEINITAESNAAQDSADANINGIDAFADDAGYASVSIDSITITALGQGSSTDAGIGNISVAAYEEATAEVKIGSIDITSESIYDNATASIDTIYASAYSNGAVGTGTATALIDIGNISLSASGGEDADANLGYIRADAYDNNTGDITADSEIELGTITISASAFDGSAEAVIGDRTDYILSPDVAILASARGGSLSKAEATVTIDKLILSATADNAGAYAGSSGVDQGILAFADDNGTANVIIEEGLDITAEGWGNTSVEMRIGADVKVDDVEINGAVAITRIGDIHMSALNNYAPYADNFSDDARARATLEITAEVNGGNVADYGNIGFDNASFEQSFVSVEVGDIHLVANDIDLDIYNQGFTTTSEGDTYGTYIEIGDIHLEATNAGEYNGGRIVADIRVDTAYDASRDAAFTADAGDINLDLGNYNGSMVFGSIDLTNFDGTVDINYNYYDWYTDDETDGSLANHTTIIGYNSATDSLEFGDAAISSNNGVVGTLQTNEAALWTALRTILNTEEYAFATFNEGSGDLNGDGISSSNLGVLAYDALGDGINGGITQVVYFVDSISLTDFTVV